MNADSARFWAPKRSQNDPQNRFLQAANLPTGCRNAVLGSIRVALAVLLLQPLNTLLQLLHNTPEHDAESLIVQGHEVPTVQVLGFAQRLAQVPGGLDVLCDEADLLGGSLDAVVVQGLEGVEGPLQVLGGDGPDVLLEAAVREVHEAVVDNDFPVVVAAGVGLDGQVGQAAGRVEADELVRRIELQATVGQCHQLALPAVDRVVLGGQVGVLQSHEFGAFERPVVAVSAFTKSGEL